VIRRLTQITWLHRSVTGLPAWHTGAAQIGQADSLIVQVRAIIVTQPWHTL